MQEKRLTDAWWQKGIPYIIKEYYYFSIMFSLTGLGTGEGSQCSNPHICSVCPLVEDWEKPLDRRLSGYNTEYHAPCTRKTSFVDIEKDYAYCSPCKWLILSSLPNSPCVFSSSQKSLTRLTHPFTHFYIVYIYHCTCSRPEYSRNTAR